jgi:hypothetical protein
MTSILSSSIACANVLLETKGGIIMPRSATNMLDLSELPANERREIQDFFQFLLTRRTTIKKPGVSYRFSDLCGTLNWKGDAVAEQRRLRDEW